VKADMITGHTTQYNVYISTSPNSSINVSVISFIIKQGKEMGFG